ncbi:hypothetical protein [Pseudomarimonas salicorniae]|uniref:Uncharacterized protein n=1 Tax=Pseudomarimonas salicorniae TaxID=2933270 RepID=A0ABT0GGY0_9GAMM|nr:hypothetical protein [Lysobacter sp. CAU 1642]MCK7593793.1 hypothetical protein [Lysobacter sp. CAU 1642]
MRTRAQRQTPRGRQQGIALWDTLLLVTLLAGFLLVSFILIEARTPRQLAADRSAMVSWAHSKIFGFAAANARLPCPDVNNDGLEDCDAANVSGLLPLRTLGLDADAPMRGPTRINFVVYRPGGNDLAVAGSAYEPAHWDGALESYGNVNDLDFCAKLEGLIASAASADAFSVSMAPELTQPQVRTASTLRALSDHLSCRTTLSSVHAIALSVDAVTEVQEVFDDIKSSAEQAIIFNAITGVLTVVSVAVSAITLASSITTLTAASTALASAVLSCAVLVGCALIPVYSAAVAAASVAIGLSAAAVAANALSLVPLAVAIGLAADVASRASVSGGGPPPDNSQQLATLLATAQDLEAAALQYRQEATAARTTADASQASATAARTAAHGQADAWDPSNTHDATLNQALDAAQAAVDAEIARDAAQGQYDLLVQRVNDLNIELNNAIAAQAANPGQTWRATVVADLTAQRDAAIVERDAALVTRNAANAAATTAQNDYIAARDLAASRYANAPFNGNPSQMIALIDDYRTKFLKAQRDEAAAVQADALADEAEAKAIEARASYVGLNCQVNPPPAPTTECPELPPGAPTPGAGLTVWAGASAVLEQADGRGAVR